MPTEIVKRRVKRIAPPLNWRKEKVVKYYDHLADVLSREFGCRPSRYTMWKYLMHGYPVQRGGPYVEVPAFKRIDKKVYTTVEATARFMKLVHRLEDRRSSLS